MSKFRALIVDDSETIRNICARLIESERDDVICIEAYDGKNAINLILEHKNKNEKIDFIISDINMPWMNGLQFIKTWSTHPDYFFIPFIMLSAESDYKMIFELIDQNIIDFIQKPFKHDTYISKINKILKAITQHIGQNFVFIEKNDNLKQSVCSKLIKPPQNIETMNDLKVAEIPTSSTVFINAFDFDPIEICKYIQTQASKNIATPFFIVSNSNTSLDFSELLELQNCNFIGQNGLSPENLHFKLKYVQS